HPVTLSPCHPTPPPRPGCRLSSPSLTPAAIASRDSAKSDFFLGWQTEADRHVASPVWWLGQASVVRCRFGPRGTGGVGDSASKQMYPTRTSRPQAQKWKDSALLAPRGAVAGVPAQAAGVARLAGRGGAVLSSTLRLG